MLNNFKYFCVSHKEIPWKLPSFMTVIGTGSYIPMHGIALSKDFPDLAYKNKYLSEYAALFALRRLLTGTDPNCYIGISHYRRFALTHPIGTLRGFNYHAHPDLLTEVPDEHFYGDGSTPIIPMMVHFDGSVLRQYSAVAIARDLLMFFGDAIESGVITDNEAADFLSNNHFITAGTAAFIPVSWFIDIVEQIERVVSRFYWSHHIVRDGYLERSIGFCAERLHGLLLAKYVNSFGWEKVVTQPLTLLVEDGAC
jgi:hypothetical protein